MARRNRLLINNSYYHIISRGNDKRVLFYSQDDYCYFISVITQYLNKHNIHITNYCLMPNHLHLLIHTPEAKCLPKFIQGILQVYAIYFRNKYNAAGFIFQNRYKSLFIDKENYLLECSRYIERNPLRAQLTESLSSYPWSSFCFYAEGRFDSIINWINPLYKELANTDSGRQKAYSKYVYEERAYDRFIDMALKVR